MKLRNLIIGLSFLLCSFVSKAVDLPDLVGNFIPVPGTIVTYKVYYPSGYTTTACRTDWTMTGAGQFVDVNGTPIPNVELSYTKAPQQIYIKWFNQSINLTASIKVWVTDCSNPLSNCNITKSVAVKYIAPPNFINNNQIITTLNIPCYTTQQTFTIAAMPNAEQYEWTFPVGWNGGTSIVTTTMPIITIAIPNTVTSQIVRARAIVGNFYGDFTNLTVTRNPPTMSVVSNPQIKCGSTTPVTYQVSAVPNATYSWSFPSTMTGNTTTTTNTNTLTPKVNFTGGTITVTAVFNCTGTGQQSQVQIPINFDASAVAPVFTQTANVICNSQSKTFMASASLATSYDWQTTGGLLINGLPSPQNGLWSTVTITAPAGGSLAGSVTVKARNSCNSVSAGTTQNVWIGLPLSPDIGGDDFLLCGTKGIYTAETSPYSTYQWFADGLVLSNPTNTWTVKATATSTYGLGFMYCQVSNGCSLNGTTYLESRFKVTIDCNSFAISPNPTTNYFNIKYIDNNGNNVPVSENYEIKVFNTQNELKYKGKSKSPEHTVNASNLPNGLYIVEIKYKGEVTRKKVVINK